jgi:hypothetical protein
VSDRLHSQADEGACSKNSVMPFLLVPSRNKSQSRQPQNFYSLF